MTNFRWAVCRKIAPFQRDTWVMTVHVGSSVIMSMSFRELLNAPVTAEVELLKWALLSGTESVHGV